MARWVWGGGWLRWILPFLPFPISPPLASNPLANQFPLCLSIFPSLLFLNFSFPFLLYLSLPLIWLLFLHFLFSLLLHIPLLLLPLSFTDADSLPWPEASILSPLCILVVFLAAMGQGSFLVGVRKKRRMMKGIVLTRNLWSELKMPIRLIPLLLVCLTDGMSWGLVKLW